MLHGSEGFGGCFAGFVSARNQSSAELMHPCGRGNSANGEAQRRCAVCYLKTIPIPVKFDRQGHSCIFHAGFGQTNMQYKLC